MKKQDVGVLFTITTLTLILITVYLTSCGVNPNEGRRVLESQGLSKVEIGGWSFFGCSERDTFRSKFTAVGVNGKPVNGVLCSSFLKGVTVRYF